MAGILLEKADLFQPLRFNGENESIHLGLIRLSIMFIINISICHCNAPGEFPFLSIILLPLRSQIGFRFYYQTFAIAFL